MQRPSRKLAVGAGERQGQALVCRYRVVIKRFTAKNKPGIVQTRRAATHASVIIIFRRFMAHHAAFVAEARKRHVGMLTR